MRINSFDKTTGAQFEPTEEPTKTRRKHQKNSLLLVSISIKSFLNNSIHFRCAMHVCVCARTLIWPAKSNFYIYVTNTQSKTIHEMVNVEYTGNKFPLIRRSKSDFNQ